MSKRYLWKDTTKYWEDKYDDVISRLREVVKRMDIEIARDEPSSEFVDGQCDGMMTARRYISEEFPELDPKEVRNGQKEN